MKYNQSDASLRSVSKFPVRRGLSQTANFFPLPDDLKDFDHVIIPMGKTATEVVKYNTILESGNYLLVGYKGKFTRQDVLRFLTNTNAETQNCVGFILIV